MLASFNVWTFLVFLEKNTKSILLQGCKTALCVFFKRLAPLAIILIFPYLEVNRLHITLGMVCLVLDNVFPDEEWRENRTNILKIYEEFKSRDSFKDTVTN